MEYVEKVVQKIKANDRFGKMVGIEVLEAGPGFAKVSLVVGDQHLNAVDITHGAAIFTLTDLAFAIASNSHDKVALALNMNISFLKATVKGSILTATATEDNLTNKTGLYRITVLDETGDTVAIAQGLAYRKKQ